MGRFQKLFPFIEKIFPPYGGTALTVPSDVGEDVSLTHELFKADIKHALRFHTDDNLTITAAGTNDVDLVREPQPGYAKLVYLATVTQEDVVNREVQLNVVFTGNPVEVPPGVWLNVQAFLAYQIPPNQAVALPMPLPVVRGMRIQARFLAMAAAVNIRGRSFSIELPLAVVDWQRFQPMLASILRNNPY